MCPPGLEALLVQVVPDGDGGEVLNHTLLNDCLSNEFQSHMIVTGWWGLASLGVLVNAVAPGAIDTPMASIKDIPKEMMNHILTKIPLKRFGRSEEVSAAVVFLASDEASYITGSTLYIDGGWLAA